MFDQNREAALRQAVEDLYFGYRAFTALPDEMLATSGLGRTHHRVLYFICRRPGISVGELIALLDVTKQAVHRPIKDLEDRGLVANAADVDDRRVRRLTATDAGVDLERRLTLSQMDMLDDAFAAVGPDGEAIWHAVTARLAGRTARGVDRP
ncbi:transcriptional regulator [Gordonia spumicola]|uniref:Transcriptional regulator n=1 Tax=Gordonia spumicola TaxID=589161 RepID=A0A7I9V6N1_9ACTN|nr:MarR family transcriptional regulator [Gordonia spumicola]GEE00884.1 transcriptional regulator [Gordonia spumicola]